MSSLQNKRDEGLTALKERLRKIAAPSSSSASSSRSWMRDDLLSPKNGAIVDKYNDRIETDFEKERLAVASRYKIREAIRAINSDFTTIAEYEDVCREDKSKLSKAEDAHHFDAIFSAPSSSTSRITADTIIDLPRTLQHCAKDDQLPLYKRLKKHDFVYAKYSADKKFYKAQILTTIQKGYPNCKYG